MNRYKKINFEINENIPNNEGKKHFYLETWGCQMNESGKSEK